MRRSSVNCAEEDGQRWLVAPFGEVNWVCNLSAAEAAPILTRVLRGSPLSAYFDVTPDSSLEDVVREAPRHPVFRLTTASSKQARELEGSVSSR
jgi:hypothetical protein